MWPAETAAEFSYSSILSNTVFFVWTPWMERLLLLLLCLPMKASTASFISLRFVITNCYFIYPLQSLIFFKKSIYFNWRIIALQYCDGFCHTSTWIRYTCVPPILKLPPTSLPNPTPQGCPRALALGALLHASKLHWLSILHMVMYIFLK